MFLLCTNDNVCWLVASYIACYINCCSRAEEVIESYGALNQYFYWNSYMDIIKFRRGHGPNFHSLYLGSYMYDVRVVAMTSISDQSQSTV